MATCVCFESHVVVFLIFILPFCSYTTTTFADSDITTTLVDSDTTTALDDSDITTTLDDSDTTTTLDKFSTTQASNLTRPFITNDEVCRAYFNQQRYYARISKWMFVWVIVGLVVLFLIDVLLIALLGERMRGEQLRKQMQLSSLIPNVMVKYLIPNFEAQENESEGEGSEYTNYLTPKLTTPVTPVASVDPGKSARMKKIEVFNQDHLLKTPRSVHSSHAEADHSIYKSGIRSQDTVHLSRRGASKRSSKRSKVLTAETSSAPDPKQSSLPGPRASVMDDVKNRVLRAGEGTQKTQEVSEH